MYIMARLEKQSRAAGWCDGVANLPFEMCMDSPDELVLKMFENVEILFSCFGSFKQIKRI